MMSPQGTDVPPLNASVRQLAEQLGATNQVNDADHPVWAMPFHRPGEPLPAAKSPDEFALELNRLIAGSRETLNPFLRMILADKVPLSGLREWFKQWYFNARTFPALVAQVIANASVQYDVRRLYGTNLIEELGELNPANEHPLLLRRAGAAIGVSSDEMEYAEPFPETLVLVEYRQQLARQGDVLQAIAVALAVELTVPGYYRRVANYLQRKFQLSDSALEFFWVHAGNPKAQGDYGGDVQHSEAALNLLKKYATTAEAQERCRQTAYRYVQVRKVWWWGMYREIVLKNHPGFQAILEETPLGE